MALFNSKQLNQNAEMVITTCLMTKETIMINLCYIRNDAYEVVMHRNVMAKQSKLSDKQKSWRKKA